MKAFYSILFLVALTACSTNIPESAIQTAIAQTQASQPSSTPLPTATASQVPTGTSTITVTPSITPTTADTPTASITPTLISLSIFKPLTFVDGLRENPEQYQGKYIKALGSKNPDDPLTPSFNGTTFLYGSALAPLGSNVYLVKNPNGDSTVNEIDEAQWYWIYGLVIEPKMSSDNKEKFAQVSVFHVDTFPPLEQPRSDGVYLVGSEIEPGYWKSLEDATTVTDCYWARSDSDGNIIKNFFGYGGTKVYVANSDHAVEFKNCGYFVYLGK